MEYATIFREVNVPVRYTGPGFPTGRYGYFDGARMVWADSERKARFLAAEDGFVPRPGLKTYYC